MRICAMVLAAWLAATTPLVAQSSTASPEARAAAKELVEVMQAVDQLLGRGARLRARGR